MQFLFHVSIDYFHIIIKFVQTVFMFPIHTVRVHDKIR